jgi:hypothetical protein
LRTLNFGVYTSRARGVSIGIVALAVVPSQSALIDEFGELDRQVQAFQPIVSRHEELKKIIKSWYDDWPAEQAAIASGKLYTLQISPRENQRSIVSIAKVAKLLGAKVFQAMATVPIKALEDRLGKVAAAKLLCESRTGSRRIKTVANAAPQQAA